MQLVLLVPCHHATSREDKRGEGPMFNLNDMFLISSIYASLSNVSRRLI